MPFDGALSASTAAFADRVDTIAAEAHEAGLGQAAVVLAQMAGLLRAMGGETERAATTIVAKSQVLIEA